MANAFTQRYPERSREIRTTLTYYNGDQHFETNAIWDTGATSSCITEEVVAALGLKPMGITEIATATEKVSTYIYDVGIILPNGISIQSVKVYSVKGDNLIGMDIIGAGDFSLSGADGRTTVSFRIPAKSGIDYVTEERKNAAIGPLHGKGNRKK